MASGSAGARPQFERGVTEQAELGQDTDWCYGAFATNTPTGQAQAKGSTPGTALRPIDDNIKEWKALGAARLPTTDQGRNSAWLQLAGARGHADRMAAASRLDGELRLAEPKNSDSGYSPPAARIIRHAHPQ